ncbi:MAG TPA: energy transducer TonB [Bacteroidales bacterium]|nr:MAG: hypothetical protein A2W98_13220 [Bacteroidetes bacterium GWF2_33_38]OFY73539.1 MAG: hypothetical protein A2265_00615 [Bacteroidetes bacterium RIFOXYA12_FULL_33_9]OFY89219.1 MAG: hypothetical protein A2236_09980 [Bacteroidetes bacterium RIFOXYA2_FULL_33_7]HBF89126.1 energy transducer TonB [Bacteroidales bacterium]
MEKKKSDEKNLEKKRTLFFQIGLATTLSICLLAFEWKSPIDKGIYIGENTTVFETLELPPITFPEKPKPPEPLKKTEVLIIKKDDTEIKNEAVIATSEANGNTVVKIDSSLFRIHNEPEIIETIDFVICQDKPEFPGGMDKLPKFIADNFEMPREIRGMHIVGKTFVVFTIDEFGNVIDASIHYGLDPYIDKEALKVVNKMPKWKPGKQVGKPVRVKYILPIKIQ